MYSSLFRCVLLGCVAALNVACGPAVDLPPPPSIDTDRYPPSIRAQFDAAWSDVQKKPASAQHNGALAMLLHTYDQFLNAASYYERAAQLDDDDFRWPYLNTWVQSELGNNDAALDSLRSALAIDDDYARARIKEAELLLTLGRLDECREVIATLQRDYPDRPEAYFVLGQLENRLGHAAEAITALNVVLERSGHFGALHYALAQAYRQIGDSDNSARHTALYAQHTDTRVGIEDPVLARVQALNRSETRLVERARSMAARGDTESARTLLEQAIADKPDSFAAHISLVGLYATRGEFALADQYLQRAAEIEPGHPQLYYNTGVARMAEQRFVEADAAFRKSLEIDPTKADAHAQLGLVDHMRKRPEAARDHFLDALEVDPWHRQANWMLGRHYLMTGQPEQAIEHLERVSSVRDPTSPAILVDLAKARQQTGDTGAALSAAREALEAAEQFDDSVNGALARAILQRLAPDGSGDQS